ncbi:MAG: hypothetical protein ACK5Q5_07590 [Planctomycetaceae bacterium]
MNRHVHYLRSERLRWRGTLILWLLLAPRAGAQTETTATTDTAAAAASPAEPVPDHAPPIYEPTRFPLSFVTDRSELDGTTDFDSYYGLLNYVRHVDPAALQQAAERVREQHWKNSDYADWPLEDFPFYYDLTKRPQTYRGLPITLTGHIQLHHVDHIENKYGLDPIHVAYLYTDDSQHHPMRVVFTENPDQIPVGEQVTNGIQVTGYFLKLYRYHDRDGKGRFMPLVLARAVRWAPTPPVQFSVASQVIAGLATLLVLAGLAWWVLTNRRRDAVARKREQELLGENQTPDFSGLP